jgi:hypothetical protein
MAQIHQNALCDPQIQVDAKTKVRHNVFRCGTLFVETTLDPPEHEK